MVSKVFLGFYTFMDNIYISHGTTKSLHQERSECASFFFFFLSRLSFIQLKHLQLGQNLSVMPALILACDISILALQLL